MTDKQQAERYDLMMDILRNIQTGQAATNRKLEVMQADILNIRKDINALRGELLRFEESLAAMGAQIDRINTRLGLNETPQ